MTFCNILNMYADAGLTQLRDGSIFFGLLPCALKVEQKVEDLKTMVIRTAGEEIKRVTYGASVAAAEAASAAGRSAGEAEASPHVLDADNLATQPSTSARSRDDDSRDALERARPALAGLSCDDAAADTPAAAASGGQAALHAEGGDGSDSQPICDSCIADADLSTSADVADSAETTAAKGDGSDMSVLPQPVAVKAEQETGVHGGEATSSSSAAAAAAASLLPARQLRLPRVLPSSSSPTASGFKSSRYNGESSASSLKAAATQAEQDNLFIRSATAPPIECFNPVFHFQR